MVKCMIMGIGIDMGINMDMNTNTMVVGMGMVMSLFVVRCMVMGPVVVGLFKPHLILHYSFIWYQTR